MAQRDAESQLPLEVPASARDQEVAGILLAARVLLAVVARQALLALGRPDRAPGHLELRVLRASRELLDRVAIAIARRKIHVREVAALAERRIDETDALEELRPIDGGHQAHAGDRVADRHVHRALPLMLLPDELVGGRPLGGQARVQPLDGGRHARIVIAQPLDQLHRELPRQGSLLEASQGLARELPLPVAGFHQAVGQGIGLPARRSAADDDLGSAPHVLHEHDPQRDRHRPELADRERLHALVGAHEPAERLRVEAAVGVRDECPCQPQDARIALEVALPRAWAAGGRSRAGDRRGSRGSDPPRRGSCRPATRRPG